MTRRKRPIVPSWSWGWLLCGGALAVAATSRAAPPELSAEVAGAAIVASKDPAGESTAESGPQYRRVFVPADRESDWPDDGQRRLSVDRREFARLSAAAQDQHDLLLPGRPTIRTASYRAELRDDESLDGLATFDVTTIDAATRLLMLDPWNLSTSAAHWRKDGAASVGRWFGGGDGDGYGALVPASGVLEIAWQLNPVRSSPDEIEFRLELPASVESTITLDLPDGCVPTLTPALREQGPTSGPAQTQRWTFRLPPAKERRLIVQRTASAPDDWLRRPTMSTEHQYRLGARGLEYQLALRMDALDPSVISLPFDLEASLKVVAATVDGREVAWRRLVGLSDGVAIDVPPGAGPRLATISAVAPLKLDRSWMLPRLIPRGIRWSEGTIALWIDPELQLESLSGESANVVHAVGVGELQGEGEVFRLQAWSQEAAARITASHPPPRLSVRQATIVATSPREATSEVRLEWRCAGGQALQTFVDAAAGWTIDRVEASPEETLADWHVLEAPRRSRLCLQFQRNPTTNTPIRTTVFGRRTYASAPLSTSVDELLWLRPAGADVSSNLLLVRSERGDALAPDPPLWDAIRGIKELSSPEQQLLTGAPSGLLLDAAQAPHGAAVRAATQGPTFQVDALLELRCERDAFFHRADFSFHLKQGSLSEVVVRFARPLPSHARWTIWFRDREEETKARRITATGGAEKSSLPVEYRIALPQRTESPFRLVVQWKSAERTEDSINGASTSAGGAATTLAVLRGEIHRVAWDGAGWTPALGSFQADDSAETPPQPPILAAFRLPADLARTAGSAPSLRRVEQSSVGDVGSPLFCQLADTTTEQYADGSQRHAARLEIFPCGAEFAPLLLSGDPEHFSCRLDGQAATMESIAEDPFSRRIRLPVNRRMVVLEIDWQSSRAPLGWSATIDPPAFILQSPVLESRWTLRLPSAYRPVEGLVAENDALLTRLCGPLARISSSDRFQPWQGKSWRDLFPASRSTASTDIASSSSRPQRRSANAWSWESVGGQSRGRKVYCTTTLQQAWNALALTAAAATMAWRGRRRRFVAAIGALSAGCVCIPAAWCWIPQGVLLGALAGVALRSAVWGLDSWNSPLGRVSLASAVLFFLSIFPSPALADSEPPHGPERFPAVFDPVNDVGSTVGDDVFVPEEILEDLHRAAVGDRHAGAAGLLLDASYAIRLSAEDLPGEFDCRRCEMTFHWRTFRSQTRCRLPLHRDEGDWSVADQRLDGAATEIAWDGDGQGCEATCAAAGDHELRLVVVPRTQRLGARRRLRLHVPNLHSSRITFETPEGLAGLQASGTAPINSAFEKNATRIIGAADELVVHWQADPLPTERGTAVDQITRLTIGPATLRASTTLFLTGRGPALSTMRLDLAPNLTIGPLDEQSIIQEVEAFSGPATQVQLRFRRPMSLPFSFDLPIEMHRAVPIGRIELPRCQPTGVEVRNHQITVTVEEGVEVSEESRSEGRGGVRTDESTRVPHIGGGAELTYLMTSPTAPRALFVAPTAPRFHVRETTEMTCGVDGARVQHTVEATHVEKELLIHRFSVDPRLTVSRVEVVSAGPNGDYQTPLRWAQSDPEHLEAFLAEPVRGDHRVVVTGRVKATAERRIAVPRVELTPSDAVETQVIVRRDRDALVSPLSGYPSLATAKAEGAEPADSMVVATMTAARGAPLPTFATTLNDPRFSVDVAVTVSQRNDSAQASCTLQGLVLRGIVDRVRLYVSRNWVGPFTIEPGGEVDARGPVYDADRNVVVVSLPKRYVAGERFSLHIAGALLDDAAQPLQAPQVRVLDSLRQRTWVVLEGSQEELSAHWRLEGLEAEPLPPTLAERVGPAAATVSLRAADAGYSAISQLFPTSLQKPATRMATVTATVDESGAASAIASFIVQPGSSRNLSVGLPGDCELLYAEYDGRCLDLKGAPQNRISIPDGPPYFPRRLILAYRRTAAEKSSALPCPKIYADNQLLESAATPWRIFAAPGVRIDGKSIDEVSFEAGEQLNTLSALDDALPLVRDLSDEERRNWANGWRPTLQRLARGSQWVVAEQKRRELLDLVGLSDVPLRPDGSSTAAVGREAKYFQTTGDQAATIVVDDGASVLRIRWLTAATMVAALAAAIRWAERLRPKPHSAPTWLAGLGVLAGLFWWAALQPSALGLAAAILAAASQSRRFVRAIGREAPSSLNSPESRSSGPAAASLH